MSICRMFTIGFTRKSAKEFFTKLSEAGVTRVLDVRLNNVSQLAAFAKKDDLAYFLKEICGCGYRHEPLFAPTKEILDGYKKKKISWDEYQQRFSQILKDRRGHQLVNSEELQGACLLCSEPEPEHCHRRLVAEYLKQHFDDVEIVHL